MVRSPVPVAILASLCMTLTLAATPSFLSLTVPRTPSVNDHVQNQEKVDKAQVYAMDVETDIHLRYAVTKVTSRVANPTSNATEAVFHLVLPESAFISGFLMEVEGKVYEALVKEKAAAQQEYNNAVSAGQTAAQVSSSARDANQFVVSVNIEAQSKVTFNLTYEQLLTRRRGVYEHTVHINPGAPVPHLRVRTNIFEVLPISDVKVVPFENDIDQHLGKKVEIVNVNATTATIVFQPSEKDQKKASGNGLETQLSIQYDVDRSSQQKGGEIHVVDGYFVHFFAPTALATLPKHVVFVLDTSGSMAGIRLQQTKEAMASILDQLHAKDIFSIVEFNSDIKEWDLTKKYQAVEDHYDYYGVTTTEPVTEVSESTEPIGDYDDIFAYPVTKLSISRAKSFVNQMQASGGTNINDALVLALHNAQSLKSRVQRTPIVIFLTDGEATEGERSTNGILNNVKKANSDRQVSIFSLAFGTGADFSILKKISSQNQGFARKIYEASDTTLQLEGFYAEVASPLLSDVHFNYQGQVSDVSETVVPNFFDGTEVIGFGRVQDQSGSVKVSVNASGSDGPVTFTASPQGICDFCYPHSDIRPDQLEKDKNVTNKKNPFSLEKMWAYSTIQHLLKQIEADGDGKQFKEKALNLSLSYGFVTPLTSLLVIKPNQTESTTSLQPATLDETSRPGFSSFPTFGAPPPQFAPLPISSGAGFGAYELFASPQAIEPPSTTFVPTTTDYTPELTTETNAEDELNQLVIDWIDRFPHNETHMSISLDNSTSHSLITLNELTDREYDACNSTSDPTDTGFCKSIWHCDVDFMRPFLEFKQLQLDRFCVIEDEYVGFCCI